MVSPQDSVRVLASQLSAGDFPPICAMTGAPAQTSGKFRFATAPAWSAVFALLLCAGIGFFVSAPLTYLVSRRASGRLPLTHASKRRLELPIWAAIFLLALSAPIGAVIAILSARRFDPANPAPAVIALLLLNLGTLAFVGGVVLLQVGFQIARLPFGPGARVMRQIPGQPDRIVELIRVHPAFVAAVNERQAAARPQSTMTN